MEERLVMTIGRDTAGLIRLSEAVDAFLAAQSAPPRAEYRVRLVVEEAVTNVIKYAWPDPTGACTIEFMLSRESNDFVVRVKDNGVAFNPLLAPQPDFDTPADLRRTGGLGVYMVKRASDSAAYRREDEHNILELRIRGDE